MPEKRYMKGQLIIEFKKNVSLKKAKKIILSYDELSIWDNSMFEETKKILIAVPRGEEEKWSKKLAKKRKIESVDFNRIGF